jgi:predicted Zn finger-like uncharacterized protein
MYTQCPECRTVFRISRVQLEARGGFVRCGQCHQVFDASGSLLKELPPAAAPVKKPRSKSARSSDAAARKKTKPRAEPAADTAQLSIPDLELLPRRLRVPTLLWAIGSVIAALTLCAQLAWAYRQDLARQAELAPVFAELCRVVDCGAGEAPDMSDIELLDQTGIAPHPKFENVLRIRAAMVNRGANALPYPLMEVTLTDSGGQLLSRRTFTPDQYLHQQPARNAKLEPGVVVTALLDVTNPGGHAMGYEIRLLPP